MSDSNQPTEFRVPNNGQLWTVVRDDTGQIVPALQSDPKTGLVYQDRETARIDSEIEGDWKVGCGSTCRVVELHVQTAEARAEQMDLLAEAILAGEFRSTQERSHLACDVAAILGFDEQWVIKACGEDQEECHDATDRPLTMGDVTDE